MTTFSTLTDADLVGRSLAGDREAFSQIVLRYQTLVCSLAYGIIGNLGQSEDAAQETFIVAWKRLRHLREPAKLRAWLCGIVNNRARDSIRRDGREAAAGAQPLEVIQEIPAPEALPSEAAIGNEEQAIMWRALCRVPEIYRQPLILYYREHNSIERVAEALELSEDAVKQRLSRGRKLLHGEVVSFVEEALRQTGPKSSFAAGVLGALPLAPTLTAAGGLTAAGKGAAAKSSGLLAVITGSVISLAGIVLGVTAQWLILRLSPSPREKRVKAIWFVAVWFFSLLAWVIQPALRLSAQHFGWSDQTLAILTVMNWWLFAGILATIGIVAFRWVFAVRRDLAIESGGAKSIPMGNWVKIAALLGGVYGANVYWLIALAWHMGDKTCVWTVTGATALLAVWHFWRINGKNRDEGLRIAVQHMALIWGMILLTINLRVTDWMAALRGMNLAPWRQMFPGWIVPVLTAALLGWIAAVTLLTRTREFTATAIARTRPTP